MDANRARMSHLVTVMDKGQRQCPTDQCHAAMDTDHRPITATEQSHALMHTDHRQHPLTVGIDTDQSVTMDTGHRLVTDAPLGRHPLR